MSADRTRMPVPIAELLRGSPYQGYTYGYPHKTAYRALASPRPLAQLWADEPRQMLDLYIHVPYCTMRCGFCNLFTSANPAAATLVRLVDQIEREADAVAACLGAAGMAGLAGEAGMAGLAGEAGMARMAIGGGTPTILPPVLLDRLLRIPAKFGVPSPRLPIAVEASPDTVGDETLQVLKDHGVSRLSLGVQSFDEDEARALGRPQRRALVEASLARIAAAAFETLNIDLIYGAAGQTPASWLRSVDAAHAWQPDEICLYPLYVRPLTGLARRGDADRRATDPRLDLYRLGRDRLIDAGYEAANMRLFRRRGPKGASARRHKCLTEATVGLGCGARSITRGLHYSGEYAVGRHGVQAILASYLARDAASFGHASYGFELDEPERRRRHIVLHLMEADGISRSDYRARFGADPVADLPQLSDLQHAGLAHVSDADIRLTLAGLERSDVIGPWLYSPGVMSRMEGYAWR